MIEVCGLCKKFTDKVVLEDVNFKIEGRTMHLANVLESYLYYMVKPEYKDELRLKILLDCFN